MKVFINGKFVDGKKAVISVFDHGFLYGDGVFETLMSLGVKVWNVDAHVDRIFNSARLMRMPLSWKKKQVRGWIVSAVRKNGFDRSRIRLTITRGVNGFDFMSVKKPTVCIIVTRNKPWPKEYYRRGIDVITARVERTYPAVKTTSLIANIIAQQKMNDAKCQEAILVDRHGHVTEGTTSNVLFVRNSTLIVPKDEALAGTTMAIVCKLARKIGMKVEERFVMEKEIMRMEECFITSV
ncbi:MAG: aminotransferase class IV, partial [Patescibacteria group bacterium]